MRMPPERLTAILLALACPPAVAADGDFKALMDEGRRTSTQLTNQIRGELLRELDRTGPLRATVVCKFSAPEATSAISRRTGMRITRVSLKPRNRAISEPDAWEQKVLLDFENRAARGEKVEGMEHGEIVAEPIGRYFRYMRAIEMQASCLVCHGPNVSEAVKAQLNVEYPHDKAVNAEVGGVRGALSLKKPL